MDYEVDIYIDGSYVRTKRIQASDPADAEAYALKHLVVEFDVNEYE